MYSSTLPSTSALDGNGWSTPRPDCFTPGKDPVTIVQEAGCAPGTVWADAENLVPSGIRSPDRPARSESLWTVLNVWKIRLPRKLLGFRLVRNTKTWAIFREAPGRNGKLSGLASWRGTAASQGRARNRRRFPLLMCTLLLKHNLFIATRFPSLTIHYLPLLLCPTNFFFPPLCSRKTIPLFSAEPLLINAKTKQRANYSSSADCWTKIFAICGIFLRYSGIFTYLFHISSRVYTK